MSKLQILHISDLHVKAGKLFDRSVVLDPMLERIREDARRDLKPEIVVVTGDIAYSGKAAEYKSARAFFDDLMQKLDLKNDRLFIVPGNHDVDFDEYRPNDHPHYENMQKLNEDFEKTKYRKDLIKGIRTYYGFVVKNYPHLKNSSESPFPFVCSYTGAGGKKVGIVGLNSAWMCRKYYYDNKISDEKRIAIGEYQIKKAVEALFGKGEHELFIFAFHHPISWLWADDARICKKYFNNAIALSGHLHDAEGEDSYDGEVRLLKIQAGAAYEGSEYPNRFQYITLDWASAEVRIDYRKFDSGDRKWCVEGEKGKDGIKTFSLFGASKPLKVMKGSTVNAKEPPEIPDQYKRWIIDRCSYMDIDKLREKSRVIDVRLPEIFIPLYAYPPAAVENRKGLEKEALREERKPSNIEDLIAEGEALLIEGHPGSGKTTLVRHLCYSMVKEDNYKGLGGYLPLLIFVKDLKGFFDSEMDVAPSAETARSLLSFYFQPGKNGLDIDTIEQFYRAKRALIIIDGLDEVDTRFRDIVVHSFADFRSVNPGCTLVLSGRPHGIEGEAMSRFGDYHVRILTLTMPQIEEFIRRWFRHGYPEGSRETQKTAEGMISEIRAHPAVDVLMDNPLMLTAICILYHDGNELPGQRAELYRKFINSLLYRRFPDPEHAHEFLKRLAFRMQGEGARGSDRAVCEGILREIHRINEGESDDEYRLRIKALFEGIEPNCGLLKYENGQYLFWHLTFQEFLTAVYLVDNSTDYSEAIRPYWGNDHYKEVIELYIGYLSIDNKKWANQIVSKVVQDTDKEPYQCWLLAAKSMIDIHKGRREAEVLRSTRDRLLEIIAAVPEPKVLVEAGEILGWLSDPRDLREFVPIRGGTYKLSTGEFTIKAFELGKYPVTNVWFREFIEAGGYHKREYWTPEGLKWLADSKAEYPRFWHERKWTCPNAPVVGVSWYEAVAFTRWLTMTLNNGYTYRLPEETEWEASAAGLERREYPWRSGWDRNRCNNAELGLERTSPVGVFKRGETPEGVSDMAGNVWEWTDSWYEEKKENKVLRGGSWGSDRGDARCADRVRLYPAGRSDGIGFRCVGTI